MDKYPTISVITPSYNQGDYIEETIKSVINQDYPNVEYILVDGGSKDSTIDVIKKYESHITYWVSEKDKGQTDAINKGFAKATGEIVCWINSDDILLPWALKTVVEFLNSNPSFSFVNGYTMRIDKYSKVLYNHYVFEPRSWYAKHGIYYINQPSLFFRREVLHSIGFLNEQFHALMDQEFVVRALFNNYRFAMIPKILAAIRLHEETKTSQNGAIWQKDKEALEMIYVPRFKFKRDILGTIVYWIYKSITLDYFRHFIFIHKWKGKSVEEYCDHVKAN